MTPDRAYDVLGLSVEASPDEIDARFRELAKTAHPDRGGSTDAIDELTEARRVAKDTAYRLRCPECGGTGKTNVSAGFHVVWKTCPACHGRMTRYAAPK